MKKDYKWLTEKPATHRGFHDNKIAPENSLLAIKNATEAGYNIEFDVHMTKTGVLVVHHDYVLTRTANQNVKVKDLDTDHLEKYPLFGTKECIPTFNDVLNTVDGKVGLIIEIKPTRHPRPVCDAVIERLKSYKGKYCLESFDIGVVNYIHKNYPDEILGQLYEGKQVWQRVMALCLKQHKKVDFLAICIDQVYLKKYSEIKKKYPEKLLITWTVRTPKQLEDAKKVCDNYIFETNKKNSDYIEPPII